MIKGLLLYNVEVPLTVYLSRYKKIPKNTETEQYVKIIKK